MFSTGVTLTKVAAGARPLLSGTVYNTANIIIWHSVKMRDDRRLRVVPCDIFGTMPV